MVGFLTTSDESGIGSQLLVLALASFLLVAAVGTVIVGAAAVGEITDKEPVSGADTNTTISEDIVYLDYYAPDEEWRVYNQTGGLIETGYNTTDLEVRNYSRFSENYRYIPYGTHGTSERNGSIIVQDSSGDYLKTIQADYDDRIVSGNADTYIHGSTDQYVVASVHVYETDSQNNITAETHIINRETGQSELEVPVQLGPTAVLSNGTVYAEKYYSDSSGAGFYEIDLNSMEFVVNNQSHTNHSTHPYFTGDVLTNYSYPNPNTGEVSVTIVKEEYSESGEFVRGYDWNGSVDINIYDAETEELVWQRTDINQSEFFGAYTETPYYIDAVADNYTVGVEVDGYEEINKSYSVATNSTSNGTYNLYQHELGQLEVDSISDDSGNPIENATVSIYDSSGSLIAQHPAEDIYADSVGLAEGNYTVSADASGYTTENKTVHIPSNDTTSTSFTLSEQATPTPTPTPTENEVIIGGGEDDDNLGVLVPLTIGGSGFLVFLLLVILGFRAQKRQRKFALLLVMLVLSSTVVPMVFVGGFSGTVQAQTTTGDADQSAALIVFTLDQPAIKSDMVYAVNPSSRDLEWKTEVNESTASAVANNPKSDEVYALSHGNFSAKPLNITVLNKSTGEIKRTVNTNITGDNLGTRTEVVDDTYYFAVGNTTYAYDADSGEVSESYSYEKSFSEAEAYDIGVSESGDLHQLNAWSDSYTTYQNGNISSTGNQSIDYAYYTDDGWIAQYNSQIFMVNESWERNLGLSTYLYDAASGPKYTFAHFGDEVYQYNASTGDREFAYTTTTPTTDSEYVDLAHMDYQSEDKHIHEITMVGTTPVGADPSGDPRIHYMVYNTTRFGDTGGSAYSARIEYQQYLDNIQDDAVGDVSTSSVTIVYDVQPTTTIIGGGEDDDGSLQEIILDWILSWIENNLGIVIAGVFGVLLVLGIIVFALTRVWNMLKMPLSVLLLPFRLVWRGMKKLVSLVS